MPQSRLTLGLKRRDDDAGRVQPLGRVLMDQGTVAPSRMVGALAAAADTGAPLDRIVVADALASPREVLEAQAVQWRAQTLDPHQTPPDEALADLLPAEFCLSHAILPWRRVGDTLIVATARPDAFEALRGRLPASLGAVVMALALEEDIQNVIARRHGAALATAAEHTVRNDESCRDINSVSLRGTALAIVVAGGGVAALALAPATFFLAAITIAIATLFVAQALKIAALFAGRRPTPPEPPRGGGQPRTRPEVSVLVPLFREDRIASELVTRLGRLSYPKALLDVVLILESGDARTRSALDTAELPPWMRVVEVPPGSVQTKPRALNYALGFCRGQVIGVLDAEDAPAPDQIDKVVDHFSRAPPQVACLQGILDFYNPRANWLSRCFAIEYATWFRILLPGLARLGFAIPLGGTTVYFRRAALEHVRGWDAHNVTEDADLGIRLARYGYETQLIATVTREEANNRLWPWIKQRSRWLKGYMITWRVHSRAPLRLVSDLGLWKALGVQLLFGSAILQFLLAPLLWSFWLILAGLPHPLDGQVSAALLTALITSFLVAEGVSLLIGAAALARSPHPGLMPWVPTMILYFPLGVLAAYKAMWELFAAPFYWDKTEHGRSAPDTPGADVPRD